MDSEYDDVISAALDGERVDAGALRRALAAPEGRDTLAAFLLLRAAAASDDVEPSEQVCHAVEDVVRSGRRTWFLAGPRVPATLAASLAVAAIAASFWLGTTVRAPNTTLVMAAPPAAAHEAPPAPAVAVVGPNLQVGAGPATGVRVHTVAEEPPKPTRVLRFVPGVDWISATQ
jgi:hypothetical protein